MVGRMTYINNNNEGFMLSNRSLLFLQLLHIHANILFSSQVEVDLFPNGVSYTCLLSRLTGHYWFLWENHRI